MSEVAGAQPTGIRKWARAFVRRLTRLRPDRVPLVYLWWAILCWAFTLATVVAVFVPGLTDSVTAERTGSADAIGRFDAPLSLRIFVAGAGAVLTGTHVTVLLLHRRIAAAPMRRHSVVREVTLAAASGFPVLALLADRAWWAATGALVLFAIAELAVHARGVERSAAADTLGGLLAALPWGVLVAYQFAAPGEPSGSWVWIALFGFAASFAAFGGYYGIARAAESRTRALRFLFRRDLHPALVLVIVVAVAVVIGLRLTVGRELFPEPDPTLWTPWWPLEPPVAWLHAILVAGLITIVAVRSGRRPLLRFGERRITAALAAAGNTDLVISVGVILLGMLVAAASGFVFLPDGWLVAVPAFKVAGVVVIGIVALLPAFRGTAARWLALVSSLYLIPVTVNGLLTAAEVELPPDIAGFPASPVQVAMVLALVALILAIANFFRARERRSDPSVLVRLAVVPLVAVHAGWLLPVAWSELGRIVLVAGVLLALLVLMPPVAADVRRHAADVLGASSGQLLVLIVFVLALPTFFDGAQLVVLGLFWLTVAVVAALSFETVEREKADVPGPLVSPGAESR